MDEGHTEDEVYTPDEWLNLNSFSARLLGSGTARWYNMAIWELRDGLEKELQSGPKQDDVDCEVAVACEWIIQAAPNLLREGLLIAHLTEASKRSLCGGSLWAGAPGLGAERWAFWKRRLGEVKESVKSQLTLDYLEQAEKAMTSAERDLMVEIRQLGLRE